MMISGTVAFSNVRTQDTWAGKPTGYSLTLTLNDSDAALLEAEGVRLKEYDGNQQRKFKSGFEPQIVDMEGNAVEKEITRGSKVRILTTLGKEPHETWGRSTYIDKIRVVEEAEGFDVPDDF